MQEQQQQQVKAILDPRGQLAYYGLSLPQHQQNHHQSGGTGPAKVGMCPRFRSVMMPTTLHSVPHSLFFPTYQSSSSSEIITSSGSSSFNSPSSFSTSALPSATTTSSACSLPSHKASTTTVSGTSVCISHSETSKIPTCSLANKLGINASGSVTTSSIPRIRKTLLSSEANTVPSNIPNNSRINVISTIDNFSSSMPNKVSNVTRCVNNSVVEDSVSSSTSSVGTDTGKNETTKSRGRQQEGATSSSRKTPPPPSRMVTRSQTAAVRLPVLVGTEEELQQAPRMKSQRRSRSFNDKEGGSSPRRLRLGASTLSNVGFDDFPLSKNPAGAGIEFGAVCPDCGVVAVTGTGWNAHQSAHRGEGTACAHCPQVFLTTHGRDAHQQLHREGHKQDVDDYCECGLCGGSFISVMYLELHLLELHGRDALHNQQALHLGPLAATETPFTPEDESGHQLFRCGICQTLFTYSLNLDCHMSLHTEVSYACALCDASFPSLDPLVTHSHMHRFPGRLPATAVHHPSSNVSARRHTNPQRHSPHHTSAPPTNPFSMWGLQQGTSGQHPTVPSSPDSATPMSIPINTMVPHMSPAMLNYCMMMSLWAGDKANSSLDSSMWSNYFNPAMTNMFNYINPHLNTNNNLVHNNTRDSKTDTIKPEREAYVASGDGSDEDSAEDSA